MCASREPGIGPPSAGRSQIIASVYKTFMCWPPAHHFMNSGIWLTPGHVNSVGSPHTAKIAVSSSCSPRGQPNTKLPVSMSLDTMPAAQTSEAVVYLMRRGGQAAAMPSSKRSDLT